MNSSAILHTILGPFFFSSLFNIFFIDFFLVCLSYSFLILLFINKIKEIFFSFLSVENSSLGESHIRLARDIMGKKIERMIWVLPLLPTGMI